ncbi:unnamed protein product [Brassica oleracea]
MATLVAPFTGLLLLLRLFVSKVRHLIKSTITGLLSSLGCMFLSYLLQRKKILLSLIYLDLWILLWIQLQIVIIQTRAAEIEDDKGIKEEIRSISSKFIDLTFQRQWNHKLRAQASLLGDGGSGEIHEEQSKHEYENISKRQELLEERAGLHLEEYETNYENNYSNPFEWMTPTFHVPEYEPDEEEPWLVDDNKTKELQVVGVVVEDGPSLHLEKQTFKQGDTEENTPTSEKENEKSGRTSEVVGLRHTLYQTQTSPLSTLPIDTPIGSPRHILMRSPMHSHIVSPLRSPTNSSGSLSDVLSLAK